MPRNDCPCEDNPLCPSQEGERTCSLCGFDFKAQYLSREDLVVARSQAAQRGLRAALALSLGEADELRSRLVEAESRPVAAPPPAKAPVSHGNLKDFQVFRDFPEGPEMVVLPAGQFMMGSEEESADEDEAFSTSCERPQHQVRIGYHFAIGKYPVTFDEWDTYARETGGYEPADEAWGRGRRPVINVSWDDTQAYIQWLSQKTGKVYRLLSEAEWEYAARAGTTTYFYTGATITTEQANFDGRPEGQYRGRTTEVDLFAPNPWGLHDMLGNVWEWVQDGYMDSYVGAPADGFAWEAATAMRGLRGGTFDDYMGCSRAAERFRYSPGHQVCDVGFRLARMLP